MATDLVSALKISAAGMRAQGVRMRVIAENLANSDSLPEAPGDAPYRRKVVTFENALDRVLGINRVRVKNVGVDRSDFQKRYDPGHPAADADGYVLAPNVKGLVEVMDMRQAQRSYEANLSVIEMTRRMLQRTLDVLRT